MTDLKAARYYYNRMLCYPKTSFGYNYFRIPFIVALSEAKKTQKEKKQTYVSKTIQGIQDEL